ncbi:cyclic nucleotide-binding domain-containing protein [Hyalangium rubrum]|uniref:Cyclic nucleotide-binding domain-containing protein n=1 Tax=Hyalangium rubrum TaxID=3103134 RepID=A0ABU5HCL8_9BACT|nr:cyclic nucleotide-binding domain-containing protein [Hyalangium sp. s54d21]MDY7231086.1 cyclic nucleotide-binding domain-containing protein [Hyalangium sp. s54d21]
MELRKLRDKATEAFAKGRFSKAAEFYEEYCKAEPKDYQARLRMGDAWVKAGQKDRAISSYQFAAEGFAREGFLPRAIAASKLILELDPAHRGVQQMLADLYARKSSGDSLPPQRVQKPGRKVELPSFTENMGVSMGPGVALIELPEEDEPEVPPRKQAPTPPPPLHAPLEVSDEEEEIAVVQGVPVPPAAEPTAPVAAPPSAPAQVRAQPPPSPEPTRPSGSFSPPGLAPRGTARPSTSTPTVPVEPPRPAAPPTPAVAPPVQASPAAPASRDETALEVDVGLGPKKHAWAALSEPLISGASSSVGEASRSVSPTALPSSAPPGLRLRRSSDGGADMVLTPTPGQSAVKTPAAPSAFTELNLEEDTLLHAVEEAALAGMKQRAADASASGAPSRAEEEEAPLTLAEEVSEEEPSVDALPNIPLFSDLPREAFIELFERCPLRRFSQAQRVFEQGSRGDAFYVICEGSVRVFRQEGAQRKEIATLGSGAFFGEMALLSGSPRMAAVESASEDTQLLEISAPVLSELSLRYPQVARALRKFCRDRLLSNVMGTSALFQPFGRKDRRTLVEKFRAREVKKNEVIIHEGDRVDGLYVVLSGEVEARKGDQVLSRLKEGELFGEISLLQKTPATATVLAIRRTSLLRLPREDFDALILSHPQILVLISELSEQRLRRTEALTGEPVMELSPEELLV